MRQDHSYLAVNKLSDGREKSTLEVNSGVDGGVFQNVNTIQVCVTFLADNLHAISQGNGVLDRVCSILNPFLDKYRVLSEDYRLSRVSLQRNFYFAVYHTSTLSPEEQKLTPAALLMICKGARTFQYVLGNGAANILRMNSFELLSPRAPRYCQYSHFSINSSRKNMVRTLSYELILDAIGCLQRTRDYRLAIVHAETAVEVHSLLLRLLMLHYGMIGTDADNMIDNDQRSYWGVKE